MTDPSPSPEDAATALARRPTTGGSLVPTGSDPRRYATVEGTVPLAPEEAVETVRSRIERALGIRGHRQGPRAASSIDERRRVTVHVSAEPEGEGAAVRVDVDVSQARAFRLLLVTVTIVSTLLLAGMAYLITPWLLVAAAVDAAVMGALIAHGRNLERAAVREAYVEANRALEAAASTPALPAGNAASD